ncbi:hypothetical protein [Fructilactobacillus sanfranciscensis]
MKEAFNWRNKKNKNRAVGEMLTKNHRDVMKRIRDLTARNIAVEKNISL